MKENAYFRFMNEQGKIELTLIRPKFVGDLRCKVYGPLGCLTIRSAIMTQGKHQVHFFQSHEAAEANDLKLCSSCESLTGSCGDAHNLQAAAAPRQRPGKMKSKLAEKSSRNPVPDFCAWCFGLYLGGICARCGGRYIPPVLAPERDEVAELVDLSLKDYLSLLPGEWYRLRYLVLRVTDFTRSKL